jgi:cytochrome P450
MGTWTPQPIDVFDLDLTAPQTYASNDMTSFWRTLRRQHPIYRHPEGTQHPGFWVLSRYPDVMAVYRDNDRFASASGNVLDTLLQGGDSAAGRMLAVTDGRRHRDLRNLLIKAFSPRVMDRVAAKVRVRTQRRILSLLQLGCGDFAIDVASKIPMETICDLLGVPEADHDHLLKLNKSALSSDDPDASFADAWAARSEIITYFSRLATVRRQQPGDDVISVLATSQIDGQPLSEDDIVSNCYSLIIGGDETSRLSMTGAIQAFAEHKDQWRLLRAGEVSVASAVEEVLRWTTPAMHFGRKARTDVDIRGYTIRAGDVVTLWNISANRDDEVFADPHRFTLDRSPNKHMTFGYGPHFCLGAHLARVEIAAMLSVLQTYVADIELNGPVRRIYSNLLSGLSSLPVALTPNDAPLPTSIPLSA